MKRFGGSVTRVTVPHTRVYEGRAGSGWAGSGLVGRSWTGSGLCGQVMLMKTISRDASALLSLFVEEQIQILEAVRSTQTHNPTTVGPFIWPSPSGVQRGRSSGPAGPSHVRSHWAPKMEHLIYMFKALSTQPAAKVNTSAALVFPKRFSRTLNILTKLSSAPASRVAASDLMAKCVDSGSDGPFRLLLLCKHECHFGCS